MARINIREEGAYAGWFDDEKSAAWRDHGSPEQTLYRTPGERWVLHTSTGFATPVDQYRFIENDEARAWLTSRDMAPPPEDEEPSRGGRPEIGNPVRTNLGGLLTSIDELAARRGESRADCIRHLIAVGIQTETKEPAS